MMEGIFTTGFASAAAFMLIPLLIALLAYKVWSHRRQTPSLQYSSLSLVKGLQSSYRSVLVYLPLGLKFAALLFVVVALARPQKADE
ncbi:MAG: BatA domain-containing protein, partial [Bdellovibrionota bacterium]